MPFPLRCYGCGDPDDMCQCVSRWNLDGDQRVAPKHRDWMARQLVAMTAGSDYVDNVRIARTGDRDAEIEYARRLGKGCCGFVDSYVRHPDGTTYAVGYNHGH